MTKENNFCSRCGKRASKDPNHIHTCTPPQALEQPAQEPVAWMPKIDQLEGLHKMTDGIPLYTHPYQWQGLTDDEINEILVKHDLNNVEMAGNHIDVVLLMNNVEQALKEKNHD